MNKLSIRSIIPNVTTLIGLCFGIIAICFALSGQFKLSVICIMMASICDVLDGRLSRLLKSESKLGAELDSLADFLNFGIAPSILIYISLLQNAGLIERVAVLSFIVFSCLRLARFNADIDSKNNKSSNQDNLNEIENYITNFVYCVLKKYEMPYEHKKQTILIDCDFTFIDFGISNKKKKDAIDSGYKSTIEYFSKIKENE